MYIRPALLLASLLITSSCSSPATKPKPVDQPNPPETLEPPASPATTGASLLDAPSRQRLQAIGDIGKVHPYCVEDERCVLNGECSLREDDDDRCYARAADCSKTAACALIGACESVPDVNVSLGNGAGACMPTEDAHCRASEACKVDGRCVAVSHAVRFSCDALLDSDCAASKACATDGRCNALEGACVKEADANATCAQREACADNGVDCVPLDNRCRNPAGFDCSATKACSNDGHCASTVEDVGGGPFVACHHSVAYCKAQPECSERGVCGVAIDAELGGHFLNGECTVEGPTGCASDYTMSACVKTSRGE